MSHTIYYIRHGETDWNAAGRFQGSQDIPLNARGEAQASHAGRLVAELLASDGRDVAALPFVSSPLGRARSTMERVRTVLGLPADGYALDERLREVGYGDWEGSTLQQMQASHPDIYAQREQDKWRVLPPAGESYEMVTLRVRAWYDQLAGDTVAVAHGGTARALMVALGLRTPEQAADLFIEQGAVYVFSDADLALYR
jgi:broad specificity phosphatase PhoE